MIQTRYLLDHISANYSQATASVLEAQAFLLVMGDENQQVDASVIENFLKHERFPPEYKTRKYKHSFFSVLYNAWKLNQLIKKVRKSS